MKKMTITLEKAADGGFFGWTEHTSEQYPGFLHTTFGETIEQVTGNLRELIADSLENDDLRQNPEWTDANAAEITFDYAYNLESFFDTYKAIKMSAIAERSGINASLLRQYAMGAKNASKQQVERIEKTVHELGKELMEVQLV